METNSSVHHNSSAQAKIALFRSLFRGREDVYPRRYENRKTGKAGYVFACANEWVQGVCEKPKIKCSDCPHRRYLSVTDDLVRWHLSGRDDGARDFVMGVYPMLLDETCFFLAADFDKTSWKEDAAAFLNTCRKLNLPAAMERSRSGKGAHIWLFFAEAISASYTGTPETQMKATFNTTHQKSKFFLSSENELQGIYPITVSNILSVANSCFGFIALRIHTILIKFLVRDLAILSHSSQISKEYQLNLKQHHHMRSCFWYTPTHVPNCSIEPPRSQDSRYNTVVKTAIDFANKVVACSKNGRDFDEENVGVALEHLLTVVSGCFTKKREIHFLNPQNSADTEKEPPLHNVQPTASVLDLLSIFTEEK